jgi:hypothetical protein
MSRDPWTPDLDVAVHDDELVIHFDSLPEMDADQIEADWEDGGIVLHDAKEVHCLRVPLPASLDLSDCHTRQAGGRVELRVHLPV